MIEPSCEICQQFFKNKKVKPICGGFKCGKGYLPEALEPENEDPFFIYSLVVNQAVFAGMGTAIDLNFNSLKFVMDLYEIENQRECFERVLKLWHWMAKLNRSGK